MSKQIHKETGKGKITFRLPTGLKSEFRDQVDNMSEVLEGFVRDYVDSEENPNEMQPLQAPSDPEEAKAYEHLCLLQKNGTVLGSRSKRALAMVLDHRNADEVMQVLKSLQRRGYLKIQTSPPPNPRGLFWVHVRPYSLEDNHGD